MVARLLNLCGLDLGPSDDLFAPNAGNPAGYWENRQFVALNDALLDARGGTWDAPPPVTDAWAARDLAALRARAATLVAQFHDRPSWGWKDPRNALTLSFWRRQLPGLKVVVCVRHPLEVVASLDHRGDERGDAGLELWLCYYRRLLATLGADDWLVTHYDAYFHDPHAELRRVAGWLGLDVTGPTISAALATVRDDLRHERSSVDAGAVGAPEVWDCYRFLCDVAGPVLQAAHGQPTPSAAGLRFVVRELRRRTEALEAGVVAREDRLAGLADRTAALEERVRALTASVAASAAAAAAATARAEAAESQLDDVTHSRGWRLLQQLWRLRLALAPIGSRRERLWQGLVAPQAREPDPTPAPAPSSR